MDLYDLGCLHMKQYNYFWGDQCSHRSCDGSDKYGIYVRPQTGASNLFMSGINWNSSAKFKTFKSVDNIPVWEFERLVPVVWDVKVKSLSNR